jgi:hypothetical protein
MVWLALKGSRAPARKSDGMRSCIVQGGRFAPTTLPHSLLNLRHLRFVIVCTTNPAKAVWGERSAQEAGRYACPGKSSYPNMAVNSKAAASPFASIQKF